MRRSNENRAIAKIFVGMAQNRSWTKGERMRVLRPTAVQPPRRWAEGERSEPFAQRFGALRRLGLEVRMFKFSTMFIRIPNVQFSTEAQLLQNPC